MRKNGSRLISLREYRLLDLFIFTVVIVAFNLLAHYAPLLFPDGALFTFTLTLPIILLVMIRWGWQSVFLAVIDGVLHCLLKNYDWQYYLMLILGNCFSMLLLLMVKFMGKQKITGKFYFSVLFVVSGWLLIVLGRSAVAEIVGLGFVRCILGWYGLADLLSLAVAIILILVFRRFDGMFEDQKHYLIRKDKERKELARRDEFGDEPIEIDEESLSILKKYDDELL